jgi:hypothetical protein
MASRYDIMKGSVPEGEPAPGKSSVVEPAWKTEQKRQLLEAGIDPNDPMFEHRMMRTPSGGVVTQAGDRIDLGNGMTLEGGGFMGFDSKDLQDE